MQPATLSASAILAYENCPAGYKASYIERAREAGGTQADLGNAIHDALMEWVVQDNLPIDPGQGGLGMLTARFKSKAAALGLPSAQHQQGIKMLEKFYDRIAENPPHVILQCEVKETFDLKVDGQTIKVTYIWDRCDQWEDGTIEVIDYKSWFRSYDAATMKQVLQVRIYGLAAAIKYKHLDPPAIWVTLDQLRYDQPVSLKFTRDDHRDTYEYLKDVARRILADDGTEERVNDNCRYCVRRDSCVTLKKVLEVSPDHLLADAEPHIVAQRAAELSAALKAAEASQEKFADWIESFLEQHEIPEFTFEENGITVKFSATNRRKVDSERIAKVVGAEITTRYGKFSMEDVDELLKSDELTAQQKSEIRNLIRTTTSTKPVAVFPKR